MILLNKLANKFNGLLVHFTFTPLYYLTWNFWSPFNWLHSIYSTSFSGGWVGVGDSCQGQIEDSGSPEQRAGAAGGGYRGHGALAVGHSAPAQAAVPGHQHRGRGQLHDGAREKPGDSINLLPTLCFDCSKNKYTEAKKYFKGLLNFISLKILEI